MFVNKFFTYLISRVHTSKRKRRFNVKSSTYCFHMKTKILAYFQICISIPLIVHVAEDNFYTDENVETLKRIGFQKLKSFN